MASIVKARCERRTKVKMVTALGILSSSALLVLTPTAAVEMWTRRDRGRKGTTGG
jgi:hypothetical protein